MGFHHMQFIYNRKSLPPLPLDRLRGLDAAAEKLAARLHSIDPARLSLSNYGRDDLANFQQKSGAAFKKYVHLLAWVMHPELPGGHETFVDYGGGHGLLSCLAKTAGFRRVVYNDIFDGCCRDARILAEALGCVADDYVCGEIHSVHQFLQAKPPASCAVASINVIEHIYDMDDFIRVAGSLSVGPMTMALSTSANPLNPIVRRRHFQQHREWEFEDGPHEGSYPMDSVKAFRTIRREIIQACSKGLSTTVVETLTDSTRGLRKDDIERCVREFEQTGKLPVQPEHPTNTCDPMTGSWQERLLNIDAVKRSLAKAGFETVVCGGYYDDMTAKGGATKTGLARLMNHGISLLGSQGARLAPCIMFHASRR